MTRTALAILVAGAVFLAGRPTLDWLMAQPLTERMSTRWIPPETPVPDPVEQVDQERDAFRALGRQVRGQFIWSSNRGGNHDIYRADLATGARTRLTTHPHVDYFSRYSPDGRQISFLRSRRPWVSFRESDGWDLYVTRSDGAGERRLAEQAYHALWTPDGRELTFTRDNNIVAIDVATGRERTLHAGSDRPTAGRVDDPMLGPDGRIVLALKGVSRPRRGIGILSLEDRTFTRVSANPSSCQVFWLPGGRGRVYWVESEGHGGTRVMHTPAPGADPAVLIDLPGAHSHEYFPRISSDGRWLVWGAAAEGHEHDRADYEMFAWLIGTPWEQAIRLTYSAGNDQWPDLWIE
jgi:dipeptidyl aminopeptidase/acylaminoacyl peptidase